MRRGARACSPRCGECGMINPCGKLRGLWATALFLFFDVQDDLAAGAAEVGDRAVDVGCFADEEIVSGRERGHLERLFRPQKLVAAAAAQVAGLHLFCTVGAVHAKSPFFFHRMFFLYAVSHFQCFRLKFTIFTGKWQDLPAQNT